MTNKRVLEFAEINDISCKVRRKRWHWLGHILRKDVENDCFTPLGWTPKGRRARGEEGDQKLRQRKSETKLGARAGK